MGENAPEEDLGFRRVGGGDEVAAGSESEGAAGVNAPGEREAVESAAGEVEEGLSVRGETGEEEERWLAGEGVDGGGGRRPPRAANSAEGEEVLEAVKATEDGKEERRSQ